MKNKVNEVNSKKMYDLFTKAEIYNETIYCDLISNLSKGLMVDICSNQEETVFIFSTNEDTWYIELNQNKIICFESKSILKFKEAFGIE